MAFTATCWSTSTSSTATTSISPRASSTHLPYITVQLPMYNEDVVAERIIKSSCLIDYPLDRLEIQVLDDSTDHSADIAKAACEEWAAKGYPIEVHPSRQSRRLQSRCAGRGLEEGQGRVHRDLRRRFRSARATSSRTSSTTSPTTRSAWCRCAGITSIAMHRC